LFYLKVDLIAAGKVESSISQEQMYVLVIYCTRV